MDQCVYGHLLAIDPHRLTKSPLLRLRAAGLYEVIAALREQPTPTEAAAALGMTYRSLRRLVLQYPQELRSSYDSCVMRKPRENVG